MFAIGYLCALVTPVLGGWAWDVTGLAWTAFVPAGSFGIVIAVLASRLRFHKENGRRDAPAVP
jgi:mannose/fructose/N-acetylgalactosamine-specific phosphotransferase system component IIC